MRSKYFILNLVKFSTAILFASGLSQSCYAGRKVTFVLDIESGSGDCVASVSIKNMSSIPQSVKMIGNLSIRNVVNGAFTAGLLSSSNFYAYWGTTGVSGTPNGSGFYSLAPDKTIVFKTGFLTYSSCLVEGSVEVDEDRGALVAFGQLTLAIPGTDRIFGIGINGGRPF